jgi:hypothetical protein
VLTGQGKFQKRRVVEGRLEISAGIEISPSGAADDVRLRRWIRESQAVLPRLRAMVRQSDWSPEPWHIVVEDLRRRVEDLEEELAQLRRNVAGA